MLNYKKQRSGWRGDLWKEFLDMTGVTANEFEEYLPFFVSSYHELYPSDGFMHLPAEIEDKLLLIWMYHKMQATPPMLGIQFGLSLPQTNDCIAYLLPILERTFSRLAVPHLSQFCKSFLQTLNRSQVQYLVVGGHAVAFHGYHRPILDFDIFISRDSANAHKLLQVLETFDDDVSPQIEEFFRMEERVIRVGTHPFTVEPFDANNRFIQLGMAPKQLEILTSISAVSFDECYSKRVSGVIDGISVPVIGLAHLKRNKQAGIRCKDADDLAHLL